MNRELLRFRVNYFLENWKMLVHLFFGTDHFGVNNELRAGHRSLFAMPLARLITRLPANYRGMRRRAFLGFLPLNDAIKLFPGYAEKHGYKAID